jgi:hypothetical protein
MKQLIPFLAFVLSLPTLALAQQDSQSLPIGEIKKAVITEGIAKDAYLWGYPLVRFERTKKLMTTTPGYGHAPINYFYHANRLPTPKDRDVANPISDSLYSSAFLDLHEQPLILQTPRIKNRYYSLQIFDAFNNNIATISSRTRGEVAGKFFITGPRYIGATPMGFEHIRIPTNFAWINGRIQTESPSQVKASYKIISKYDLKPYNVYLGKQRLGKAPALVGQTTPQMDPSRIADAGVAFFDELGAALRENEPTGVQPSQMNRFRTANIGAGIKTSGFLMNRETRDSYARAIAAAELDITNAVRNTLVINRNGWNYVVSITDAQTTPVLRAAMSKVYFGQPTPQESLHPVSYVDNYNARLNGNATYILRFAKGALPPVGAYWSVSPYNLQQKNLITNNLRRYALGSYTKNLNYNPDGSLDIYVSANEPRGFTQNWLPVPRSGFYIMMSMYNPTNDVINGKYTLPRVQRINLTPVISSNN